jgi:hypothetical protein
VQTLQDRNHFLNETTTGLEKLVWQVRFQLDKSHKQVTYLKRVIQKKVSALKISPDLQAASNAATETLKAQLTDVQFGLTAFQGQQLAELCIEKNLVASLKTELATAYVSSIPLPQTLDDLAANVKQLVTCTSKPGCHLITKVKVICELMLSTIFDVKCQTYLLRKASGLVKTKNPYQSAMQIAKVIEFVLCCARTRRRRTKEPCWRREIIPAPI